MQTRQKIGLERFYSVNVPAASSVSRESHSRVHTEGVVRLLSDLFTFEALFVLFLFAGRFKTDPRLQWVPVDLTLLFFVASVGVGLVLLVKRRFRVSRNSFSLLLLALALPLP